MMSEDLDWTQALGSAAAGTRGVDGCQLGTDGLGDVTQMGR